jgi:heme-degrading monooxygenase HmoA
MTTTTHRQQPPITPASGLVNTDWLPGPSDGTLSPVVVSYTDFHSNSGQDFEQIAALGMKLAESWPIMRGAVGVWLWAKPAEWRGGSVSVWDSKADMRRFIRWPVHTAIIEQWRGRITVFSSRWDDERFDPAAAWLRAEEHMRAARDMSGGSCVTRSAVLQTNGLPARCSRHRPSAHPTSAPRRR